MFHGTKSTSQASTEALPIYFFAFPALADFLAAGDLPPAFFTTFLLLALALAGVFFPAAALPAGFFATFDLGFFGDFEAAFFATAFFLFGVFLAPAAAFLAAGFVAEAAFFAAGFLAAAGFFRGSGHLRCCC